MTRKRRSDAEPKVAVALGQVWQDTQHGRLVRVVEIHPDYAAVRNIVSGKITRVYRDYFDASHHWRLWPHPVPSESKKA